MKSLEADRAAKKRMYWRRRRAGLCTVCAEPCSKTICSKCAARRAAYNVVINYEHVRRWRRRKIAAGMCINCGHRRAQPPRRFDSDKEALRLCLECGVARAVRTRARHGPKVKPAQKCGGCGQVGHKRPTCPVLIEQQRDRVELSTGLGNWSW